MKYLRKVLAMFGFHQIYGHNLRIYESRVDLTHTQRVWIGFIVIKKGFYNLHIQEYKAASCNSRLSEIKAVVNQYTSS